LNFRRTIDGFNNAGKLSKQAVAQQFHNAAAMFGDPWINDFATVLLQQGQRARLILAHHSAVADGVSSQYCSQPSFHYSAASCDLCHNLLVRARKPKCLTSIFGRKRAYGPERQSELPTVALLCHGAKTENNRTNTEVRPKQIFLFSLLYCIHRKQASI
jgi:hypothetical protein